MSNRWKGGFIQAYFDPLTVGAASPFGPLYSWGDNGQGQLGQNTPIATDRSSPVQVGALTNWLEVAGGDYSSAGITASGALYMWGKNLWGTLAQNNGIDYSSPVQVGALTNWSKVEIGSDTTVALKTDGTLWGWGDNSLGSLGQNNTISRSSPIQIGSDSDWAQISCQISSGGVMAIKTSGALWAIGGRGDGTGTNTGLYRSSPVQVGALTNWSFVSSGWFGATAIKTDGTLWTWGSGSNGLNGQDNIINYSSPVQIGALTNWSTTDRGRTQAGAINTAGELYMWGDNSQGQLGLNTPVASDVSSPTQVGTLTDWNKLATKGSGATAIKTDGTLWAWGDANLGQTAQNNLINRSSPVQVGSDTDWNKIGKGYRHVLATKSS